MSNGCQIGLGLGVRGSERLDHAAFSSHRKPRPTLHVLGQHWPGAVQLPSRPMSSVSPWKDRQHDGIGYMTLVLAMGPSYLQSIMYRAFARHVSGMTWPPRPDRPSIGELGDCTVAFAGSLSPATQPQRLGTRNGQQFPPQKFAFPSVPVQEQDREHAQQRGPPPS